MGCRRRRSRTGVGVRQNRRAVAVAHLDEFMQAVVAEIVDRAVAVKDILDLLR